MPKDNTDNYSKYILLIVAIVFIFSLVILFFSSRPGETKVGAQTKTRGDKQATPTAELDQNPNDLTCGMTKPKDDSTATLQTPDIPVCYPDVNTIYRNSYSFSYQNTPSRANGPVSCGSECQKWTINTLCQWVHEQNVEQCRKKCEEEIPKTGKKCKIPLYEKKPPKEDDPATPVDESFENPIMRCSDQQGPLGLTAKSSCMEIGECRCFGTETEKLTAGGRGQ